MMKIESVASQPDRAGRHAVRLSDGSVLRLYRQTVEDFGIYPGMELTDKEISAIRAAAGAMSAKMRAVRIVAASSVSKNDLEQRLIRKGEDPGHAKDAVCWMSEMDLLDDRKTAEQVVHRCAAKGYGIARAKQALYEKRIPKEYWDDALRDYPDQQDAIVTFLRTRLHGDTDARELRKTIDALLRRGHSYSQIRRGLEQLELETEDFPEEDYG
jgi:regulatory protein